MGKKTKGGDETTAVLKTGEPSKRDEICYDKIINDY